MKETENKLDLIFDLTKKAFEEIFFEMIDEKIESGDSFEINAEKKMGIIVGLAGEINGKILLTASLEHAKNLASKVVSGMELIEEKDLYIYLGKFSGLFCNRATKFINAQSQKKELGITPPAFFSAKELYISTPHVECQKAYYKSELGDFILEIGIREEY